MAGDTGGAAGHGIPAGEGGVVARVTTDRIRCNPQIGRMPTLQFCRPEELRIDPAYQRDVSGGQSQALIRRLAQHWNWDLCQPLVVARRSDFIDRLFVIDGQHRLEAARLRGDIAQLPCVIVACASTADEAASFVHLNQQRRALSSLDLFRAAVASGDSEACAITAALDAAGLSLAATTNSNFWKPGQITNIGGIQASWRRHGARATVLALRALAEGFSGQILRYAGTLFPGIAAVCNAEISVGGGGFDMANLGWDRFTAMLAARAQTEWRNDIARMRADDPNLKFAAASARVIGDAWAGKPAGAPAAKPPAVPVPDRAPLGDRRFASQRAAGDPRWDAEGKGWCAQCDRRVTCREMEACKSQYCALRGREAA